MDNELIQIIEKPDWISWEDIKQCLVAAHSVNRSHGIEMAHYRWPSNKILDSLGPEGGAFVALDNNKVVGTAAISERIGKAWYTRGRYGYMCFAGVLPEYSGHGIYKALVKIREEYARNHGFKVLIFDTHCENKRVQDLALKNSYKYVNFFRAVSNDHFNVVMAKWPDGCPYSDIYCLYKYRLSKIKAIIKEKLR